MGDQATATEATVGNLKIPAPKTFSGKKDDEGYEYENYSRQLKAYLSLQTPRFKELMVATESAAGPIGMPADEDDKHLARQLQNFLILTCIDKAGRIVYRDDSDENGFESWRRLYQRYAPTKRVRFLGLMQKIL